jgi:MinD superfamily P-loop ATPase
MKVVSVINYKGGVGKTSLTANLGAELAWRLGCLFRARSIDSSSCPIWLLPISKILRLPSRFRAVTVAG